MAYNPKRMPFRCYEGAPAIVREKVAFLCQPKEHCAGLPFDILLAEGDGHGNAIGIDIGEGMKGQHFFLAAHEAREYRSQHNKRRANWQDVPSGVQETIIGYLESSV